jgi:hypothetical protein
MIDTDKYEELIANIPTFYRSQVKELIAEIKRLREMVGEKE